MHTSIEAICYEYTNSSCPRHLPIFIESALDYLESQQSGEREAGTSGNNSEITRSLKECCGGGFLVGIEMEYETILQESVKSNKTIDTKKLPSHMNVEGAISFIARFLEILPEPFIGIKFFLQYILKFPSEIGK